MAPRSRFSANVRVAWQTSRTRSSSSSQSPRRKKNSLFMPLNILISTKFIQAVAPNLFRMSNFTPQVTFHQQIHVKKYRPTDKPNHIGRNRSKTKTGDGAESKTKSERKMPRRGTAYPEEFKVSWPLYTVNNECPIESFCGGWPGRLRGRTSNAAIFY